MPKTKSVRSNRGKVKSDLVKRAEEISEMIRNLAMDNLGSHELDITHLYQLQDMANRVAYPIRSHPTV